MDVLVINFRYKGVERNGVVGIFFERLLEYFLVYFVILKVGGVYLFLEFFYFKILFCLILEDVKFVVVIMDVSLK